MTGPVSILIPEADGPRLDAAERACDRAVAALVATLPTLAARTAAIERIRDDWAAYLLARTPHDTTT